MSYNKKVWMSGIILIIIGVLFIVIGFNLRKKDTFSDLFEKDMKIVRHITDNVYLNQKLTNKDIDDWKVFFEYYIANSKKLTDEQIESMSKHYHCTLSLIKSLKTNDFNEYIRLRMDLER